MFGLAIRPTFQIPIGCPKSQAIALFEAVMKTKTPGSLYIVHGEYSEFHLEDHLHRLWSPHLSVYFVDDDQPTACKLIGRFAPRPNLWTLISGAVLLHFFCDPLWRFPMDARALSMGLGRRSPLDDPLRVAFCSKPDRPILVPRPNGIAPQPT